MKKRKQENINNTNNINDAMSHIDDDLLDSALLMRRVLQQNQPIRNPARTVRKIAVLAACLAVATTATIIAVVAAPADQPIIPADPTTSATTTSTSATTSPEFIAPFERPTLAQLYEMEPYNHFIPQAGLEL